MFTSESTATSSEFPARAVTIVPSRMPGLHWTFFFVRVNVVSSDTDFHPRLLFRWGFNTFMLPPGEYAAHTGLEVYHHEDFQSSNVVLNVDLAEAKIDVCLARQEPVTCNATLMCAGGRDTATRFDGEKSHSTRYEFNVKHRSFANPQ